MPDDSRARLTRAVYAGSFDPPTNGHLYMIREGARLFSELVVAIGDNPDKSYSFPLAERHSLLERLVAGLPNVKVDSFCNRYLVDYAEELQANALLRGIRNAQDLLYEQTMRNMNSDMKPAITTVFLMPPRELCEISSSFVKGLVGPTGWRTAVSRLVPEAVVEALSRDRD
jgi:pantetheine-phosphate adenylyltransferase